MRLLLTLFLWFTLPTQPDPVTADRTPRMNQIEQHFHMRFIAILHSGPLDFWVFMAGAPDSTYHEFPVVVAPDSDNHDVDVALIAAKSVASFYDYQLRDAKPTPTASPTH
jgi:hypothetical protein